MADCFRFGCGCAELGEVCGPIHPFPQANSQSVSYDQHSTGFAFDGRLSASARSVTIDLLLFMVLPQNLW